MEWIVGIRIFVDIISNARGRGLYLWMSPCDVGVVRNIYLWTSPSGGMGARNIYLGISLSDGMVEGSFYLWTSRGGGRVGESSFALAMTSENTKYRQQYDVSRSFETARDDAGDCARLIALGGAFDVIFPHHGARDGASRDLHFDPDRGFEISVAAPFRSLGFGFFFASSLS